MQLPDIQGWVLGISIGLGISAGLTWLIKHANDIPALAINIAIGILRKYIADKVDEPTKRMFRKWAQASFVWAEEELSDIPGTERMDKIVVMFKSIPVVGLAFAKNETKLREFLQVEWIAWDQELKRRAAQP